MKKRMDIPVVRLSPAWLVCLSLVGANLCFAQSRARRPAVVGEYVYGLDAIAAGDRLLQAAARSAPTPAPVAKSVSLIPVPKPSVQPPSIAESAPAVKMVPMVPVPKPPVPLQSASEVAPAWDELSRAREYARAAIDASLKDSEARRPTPINVPAGTDTLARELSQDLAAVSRGQQTPGAVPTPTLSLSLAAGGVASLPVGVAASPESSLDGELQAFEKAISKPTEQDRGGEKLLAVASIERVSSRYTPSAEEVFDDAPMLVPKHIAKVKRPSRRISFKPVRRARLPKFSASARGSTRDRIVKLDDGFQVVERVGRLERRGNTDMFPSKGRGKNVRIVDAGGEEE